MTLHTLGDTLSDAPTPIKSSERRRPVTLRSVLLYLATGGLCAVLGLIGWLLARALAGVA